MYLTLAWPLVSSISSNMWGWLALSGGAVGHLLGGGRLLLQNHWGKVLMPWISSYTCTSFLQVVSLYLSWQRHWFSTRYWVDIFARTIDEELSCLPSIVPKMFPRGDVGCCSVWLEHYYSQQGWVSIWRYTRPLLPSPPVVRLGCVCLSHKRINMASMTLLFDDDSAGDPPNRKHLHVHVHWNMCNMNAYGNDLIHICTDLLTASIDMWPERWLFDQAKRPLTRLFCRTS